LIAGALTAAAIAYLMLLRDVRCSRVDCRGHAGVLAGMNLYIAAALPGPNVPARAAASSRCRSSSMVTALGMQLMTFEI
jgi:hypothetical protein